MKKVEERNRGFMFMFEGVLGAILKKTLNALQKPAFVVIVLAVVVLVYTPSFVLGASGGRMGGSSFRSSSSSSSSDSSRPVVYSTCNHYYHARSRIPTSTAHTPTSDEFDKILLVILVIIVISGVLCMLNPPRTTIIKLQVCLFGSARSLQKDLDQIAECVDTSTRRGWSYILKKTTKALLKREDSWFSAHSSVDVKSFVEDGETLFEEISTEECVKFDKETLVNVNNMKWKGTSRLRDDGTSDGYIVVTILVATKETHTLPSIKCSKDLNTSLQNLTSISTENILGVEVLWTPQEENDILSGQELHESYPLLSQPLDLGMS